jgi:2-oxo-4-hydroxy-4-carboxy-5-ureidoimidazoline decarboxylase
LTGEADWLEAFDGHPKIGDTQALQGGPQTTAMQEQGQVKAALASTRQALARLNQAYLAQFGFIFIICASGQSAEAMLTVLEQSLSQSRADELQRAASEQFKILTGRLKAWFE